MTIGIGDVRAGKAGMRNALLFEMGVCETSELAHEELRKIGVDPQSLLWRHQRGDWGIVPDWRVSGNEQVVQGQENAPNVVVSRYALAEGLESIVVTSLTRAQTRLQLVEEYQTAEVSSLEGYAVWATDYDVSNYISPYEEAFVHPIIEAIGPVSNVADVGTGTGRYALHYAKTGASVVAIDESREMLSVAQSKAQSDGVHGIRWIRGVLGVACLPLRSDSFDVVVSALMLNHVEDLERALGECGRIVRQDGILILSVFHPAAVLWFGWGAGFETPARRYAVQTAMHTREDYLDALAHAGFELREAHDIASGGTVYGDVSEPAVREKGDPPRCLVLVGQRT